MKTLGQIIGKQQDLLPELIHRSHQLNKLNQQFKSLLDLDLAVHCHLAKIANKEALVVVDNAAWATRLRYAIPDILKSISVQPEFKNIKKIRYRIDSMPEVEPPQRFKKKLSQENEGLWRETMLQLREKMRSSK